MPTKLKKSGIVPGINVISHIDVFTGERRSHSQPIIGFADERSSSDDHYCRYHK